MGGIYRISKQFQVLLIQYARYEENKESSEIVEVLNLSDKSYPAIAGCKIISIDTSIN